LHEATGVDVGDVGAGQPEGGHAGNSENGGHESGERQRARHNEAGRAERRVERVASFAPWHTTCHGIRPAHGRRCAARPRRGVWSRDDDTVPKVATGPAGFMIGR
jgi:hypothetical protein